VETNAPKNLGIFKKSDWDFLSIFSDDFVFKTFPQFGRQKYISVNICITVYASHKNIFGGENFIKT